MLEIKSLDKGFKHKEVLKNINLTFENGVYGLLAPNGAGKTTLIKLLTTLLFPDKGEILWQGQEITQLGSDYRGILGYLPQDFGFYGNYTPVRFLRYIATLQQLEKRTVNARIDELLELVALTEVKNKKLKTFSGGMIQRVGIAQAMLHNPKLLILDEPTAGLDPKERVRFRNLIYRLSQDRIVLLSTHIVSDVETIASQIIMLKDHEVHCVASAQEISQVMQGHVFEIPGGIPLTSGQLLLSEVQNEQGIRQRIASAYVPVEGQEVRPTLEDAFLYIYRDEVRADDFTPVFK